MASYELQGLAHGRKKKSVAEKKHPMPKHGIKHTRIEHNNDGSHSISHTYQDGSDSTHSATDLDALHDHLEEVMGTPNQGEADATQQAEPQAQPAQ